MNDAAEPQEASNGAESGSLAQQADAIARLLGWTVHKVKDGSVPLMAWTTPVTGGGHRVSAYVYADHVDWRFQWGRKGDIFGAARQAAAFAQFSGGEVLRDAAEVKLPTGNDWRIAVPSRVRTRAVQS
jgi:hypothetical protein